ncbi:MAG: hypothetical protein AAF892_11735 [Cyanobacteria bacterium P01_D01_bin.71]
MSLQDLYQPTLHKRKKESTYSIAAANKIQNHPKASISRQKAGFYGARKCRQRPQSMLVNAGLGKPQSVSPLLLDSG